MTTNHYVLPVDLAQLESRLKQVLPGIEAHRLMVNPNRLGNGYDPNPEHAKRSAVMVLLFYKGKELHTAVIQRTIDGGPHSGQISFPGGKSENEDANLVETAKRECFEEVGIDPSKPRILGKLSKLYIPVSNYMVQPVVGYLVNEPEFSLQRAEVEQVLVLPLSKLFENETKGISTFEIKGKQITTPVYQLDECMIWGATAMILSELEVVCREVGILAAKG